MASKGGYEPIPDVEKGEGGDNVNRGDDKQKYEDCNDKETKLLLLLDRTIDNAGLHFSIPSVKPEELDFEAKGICYYAFAPTIPAIFTLMAAFCLEKYAQVSDGYASLTEWGIVLFPYINAVIVFILTVAPIQERLMRAIQPVFAQTEIARETVNSTIDEIPKRVDQKLDQIAALANEVLEPLKPTLGRAAKHSDYIQKVYPDFVDVPTPSEIEQDIESAKGLVGAKVSEARKYVVIEGNIPRYMRSAREFYWRIVFPILAVALIVQLVMAFVSTLVAHVVENGDTGTFRFLGELAQETQGSFEHFENETAEAFQEFKEEAGEAVGQFEENVGEAFEEFQSTFVDEMKGLALAVLFSYLTALLEMVIVYLLTSPKVHAMLVNAAMDRVAQEAERTLRQHGVSEQVVDVLETRMMKTRKKTLKLLRAKRKIDEVLSKAGGLEAVTGAVGAIASLDRPFKKGNEDEPNADDRKDEGRRRGGLLGLLFGKSK